MGVSLAVFQSSIDSLIQTVWKIDWNQPRISYLWSYALFLFLFALCFMMKLLMKLSDKTKQLQTN